MSQTHNIAIIAGQLVVGGAERELYVWLSNLDRDRFKPIVITLHPGHNDYWEGPIEALGVPVVGIPQSNSRLARISTIVRALLPYRPHLIHGWHLFASPYAGMAGKLLGARSLGFLQASYELFQNSHLEGWLAMWLTDAMMANSYCAGRQLQENWKHKRHNIHVVQNAVEAPLLDREASRAEISKCFNISSSTRWIGALGRLVPMKRFDLLINIVKLLRDEIDDFHFFLIGAGPEKDALQRLAASLNVDRAITFVGELPDARNILGMLDVFCFTSLDDEGLPNVVMEAAAAGVPIVAWRVPFVEEILVDGQSGLLIEPQNLIEFKNAILKLMFSSSLRKQIGETARNHMSMNFSLERLVQRMTSVYEIVLNIS